MLEITKKVIKITKRVIVGLISESSKTPILPVILVRYIKVQQHSIKNQQCTQ